tara:strand:+ start:132 stop:731 length:600 start_codon:yes stop_codon:yes gene_type:complete
MSLEKSNGRNEPLIIKLPNESYDLIIDELGTLARSKYLTEEEQNTIINAIESIDFLSDYEREVLEDVAIAREEDKHVFGTDKIDPEAMPTCDGCGGQKEHPTKLFSYPPENGLCAMELDECEEFEQLAYEEMTPLELEYYEGEPCPFCEKDYDEYGDNGEFFDHTEGGGSAGDLEHYYSCPHCNKSWVNISCFKTQEVK